MSEIKRRPEYIPPVPEVIGIPAPTPVITPDVPAPPQVDPGNDWGDLSPPPDSPEIPDPLAVNPQRPVLPKSEEPGERTGEHDKPEAFAYQNLTALGLIVEWKNLCHVARRPRHDAAGKAIVRQASEKIPHFHARLRFMKDDMFSDQEQAAIWDTYINLCWIAGVQRDDSVMPEMYRQNEKPDS